MIHIGIIGCGKIAQVRHIPEYAANPDAELAGYFNPKRFRAEEMAAKYGGKVYDTAEELLADPAIDAVSICAANYAHAELTVKALKAGKHVLCEKPMATTIEDCEAMLAAAKDSGKTNEHSAFECFAFLHSSYLFYKEFRTRTGGAFGTNWGKMYAKRQLTAGIPPRESCQIKRGRPHYLRRRTPGKKRE